MLATTFTFTQFSAHFFIIFFTKNMEIKQSKIFWGESKWLSGLARGDGSAIFYEDHEDGSLNPDKGQLLLRKNKKIMCRIVSMHGE